MGTYTIVIEGHGINGNGTPQDADEMARKLVADLAAAGHAEVRGVFVYGPKLIKNGTIERACFDEQQKIVAQGYQDRVRLEPPACTWERCTKAATPHTHYGANQMRPLEGGA